MEKVGIHKRDILVDRVEDARDAQSEAQEQFGEVIKIENTDQTSNKFIADIKQ